MLKYRIVESHKGFKIEVLREYTKGYFKTTNHEEWVRADENGNPFMSIYQIPTFAFKTLDNANKVIKGWRKGVTIHDVV